MLARVFQFFSIVVALAALTGCQFAGDNRHNVPLPKALVDRMAIIGSSPGEPMMIRVYKQTSELEVWKRTNTGRYALLKTYPICKWASSGRRSRKATTSRQRGFTMSHLL